MKGYNNLMKQKTERIWIEKNEDINLINYWYYRYLTNRYYKFLLNHFVFDEVSEQ